MKTVERDSLSECQHKSLKNLEESTFHWCTFCGTLYHFVKLGGVVKQVKGGIYFDFSGQTDGVCCYDKHNFRAKRHEHDWFKLTCDYKWCRICGALGIKKTFLPQKLSSPVIHKGILFPKRVQARLEILKEANLL
jgi:hypothetical protein